MDGDNNLPLFQWASRQTAAILIFPLARRTGKIRDVARKMAATTTEAHSTYYAGQVSNALERQLARYGISEPDIGRHLREFWSQVSFEEARQRKTANGGDPRGAA